MTGFKPSPVFEFFVYSIFRMRGEDECRARIFRIYESGHHMAMIASESFDEQEEINDFKRFNKIDVFFKCVKRRGVDDKGESFRSVREFVSEIILSNDQVEFFRNNRVMMK